jgi:hypothetical protein
MSGWRETAQSIGKHSHSTNNDNGSGNTNDRKRTVPASMRCSRSIPKYVLPPIDHEQRRFDPKTGTGPDYAKAYSREITTRKW